uniref:RanBP2-type domain-containing protein n=1 Tax=Glossina palpalis gambiensis TaxID=67801 RepID=A0A1B0BI86_9MUSC
MSDFVSRDRISNLWEEILNRHWRYLDAEENVEKLEQRIKIEDCFYSFLNIVEPDRKFFLPETSTVLRNSIRDLPKFSIDKALSAFEAISQYANNLYTKPWRKEFRILKMYSGFFQHVIHSCLLDVEKLFEAMGYSRVSDDLLILDGPICPDQVANVSRDAMAAYVELQILKQILGGLNDLGLSCSWLEIYRYRESHVCNVAEAIENLSYYRNEDNLPVDNYSYIKLKKSSAKPSPIATRLRNRGGAFAPHLAGDPRRVGPNIHINCYPYPCINQNPATMYNNLPCRPSLDIQSPHTSHYSEPNALATLPQHNSLVNSLGTCQSAVYYPYPPSTSFYDSPYEYLGSPVDNGFAYAAVSQAGYNGYNVSGNRYPLPYNISNQFDNCNAVEPNYATIRENRSHPPASKGHYDCSNNPTATCYTSVNSSATTHNGHHISANNLQRQSSYPPDQLIDFDEKNDQFINKQNYAHQTNDAMYGKDRVTDIRRLACRDFQIGDGYVQNNTDFSSINQQCGHAFRQGKLQNDDTYIYALPTPKENRTPRNNLTANDANNREDSYQMRKNPNHECFESDSTMRRLSPHSGSTSERDMSDLCSDSTRDEATNNACGQEGEDERKHSSPTQLSKNQDGFGSFESWHQVFQNLQPNGHSRDAGDGDDMLMQSLDLDSLNLANDSSTNTASTERRRSQYNSSTNESKPIRLAIQNGDKARTLEKTHKTAGKKQEPETAYKSTTNDNKKMKSALKQPNKQEHQPNSKNGKVTTTTSAAANKKSNKSFADNKSNEFKKNGNNNQATANQKNKPITMETKQQTPCTTAPITQVIVTSPQEWNCPFCTFLNLNSGNICEICFKTKDFHQDANVVAHNAPTCV